MRREMEAVSAVVLAGDDEGKALWKFRGDSLVDIALRSLSDAGIDEVIVVGSPAVVAAAGNRTNFVEGPGYFEQNLIKGLKLVHGDEALVVNADQPLINGEVLRDFLRSCRADAELQIGYPIVESEECEQHLPGMKRTTMVLKEGCFTGGNVLYVSDKSELIENQEVIATLFRARKSKLELAKFLGYEIAVRYMLAKRWPNLLSIRDLESVASKKLGAAVRAVRSPYQLGADADSRAQLRQFDESA